MYCLDIHGLLKVKLFLRLIKHHSIKTYWGSASVAAYILNLGRSLAAFPRRQLDRWLGGIEGWYVRCDDEENPCPCREFKPGRPTRTQSVHWRRHLDSFLGRVEDSMWNFYVFIMTLQFYTENRSSEFSKSLVMISNTTPSDPRRLFSGVSLHV
jgi:hypothetical protein